MKAELVGTKGKADSFGARTISPYRGEEMELPSGYLVATGNLEAILAAIRGAKAPAKFTISFLEGIGFSSSNDRRIITVLKDLGFLDANGQPTQRYFDFLDSTRSAHVLAEAIEETWAPLFQVNREAYKLEAKAVKEKLKTLSQGSLSENVLELMARTFVALCKQADFETKEGGSKKPKTKQEATPTKLKTVQASQDEVSTDSETSEAALNDGHLKGQRIGGFAYHINLILPDARDKAVYDALFKSLREHLLDD